MASSPHKIFVPTLDIDLVWHTHQLFSEEYQYDCIKYVGRFVDQWVIFVSNIFLFKISDVHSSNDKVEGSKLSSAFDETCKAWKVGNKKLIWNIWISLTTATNAIEKIPRAI